MHDVCNILYRIMEKVTELYMYELFLTMYMYFKVMKAPSY